MVKYGTWYYYDKCMNGEEEYSAMVTVVPLRYEKNMEEVHRAALGEDMDGESLLYSSVRGKLDLFSVESF